VLPIGVEPSRSRLFFVAARLAVAARDVSLEIKHRRCGFAWCGHNLAENGSHDNVVVAAPLMAPCLYFTRKRDPFFEAMHKDFVSIHFVREDREERIGRLVYKAPDFVEGRPIYERAEHRINRF